MKLKTSIQLAFLVTLTWGCSLRADQPVMIADFEESGYRGWKSVGDAFGASPAQGTLPGQMNVEGFVGKGLVNSFHGGDGSTGKLTSFDFLIERKFIVFRIGGGGWENKTCMNLLVEGKVVRTATGPNTEAGGSEALEPAGWDVSEYLGKEARIEIVDDHQGGWGHINVDQILQADTNVENASKMVKLETVLTVNANHLIIPVANNTKGAAKERLLGIYDGDLLVQSFTIRLPQGDDAYWLAAYPLEHFRLNGKKIRIAPVDGKLSSERMSPAFARIKIGSASDAFVAGRVKREQGDYTKPYRNEFHPSTRRGWNNDPNGMVYHDGKYHLYFQLNPFGIGWGNMHWGHFESDDMIFWSEKPIALFQKTVSDMAFSGGGFVDVNDTAGIGKNTLFVAFTSTGRGECLAYSKDGGVTFKELDENPVVKHAGRDPKIIWYAAQQKWVMVVYDESPCSETEAIPPANDKSLANRSMAFYESKNLREWTRTGAFTDADREAVFECPEMFELPLADHPGESRWILLGAQNRYFIGNFDGKTFTKESGPHGTKHGAFYAAQTFSDVPDGRRIQMGWVTTNTYLDQFPDEIVSQSFSLPHELTLRKTKDGPRVFFTPIQETQKLRGQLLGVGKDLTLDIANELLQSCENELSEVVIEFADAGPKQLTLNGIDASFEGRMAHIFTDSTFNEVYADDGGTYEVHLRDGKNFESTKTSIQANKNTRIRSLRIFRLKSIWE